MKQLFAMLLALVMVLGLFAGCTPAANTDPSNSGSSGAPNNSTGSPNATDPTDPVDPEAERYGGHFTLAWTPGDTLDPMKTSGWKSYAWAMNVYENVLNRDSDGTLAPGVCDFELSDDNLKLTLWVREGVTFHDGTAVEIEDVLASIQRASGTVSRMKKHYVPYLKSETIEGDKLIIEFTEYSIDTLWYFAADQTWNVVMPKEICEKYGTDNAIIEIADAIGTGPYKVTGFNAGVEVNLARYEGYVAVPEGHSAMAAPKKAYFDTIDVISVGDSNVDMMKIVEGQLSLIGADESFMELYKSYGLNVMFDNTNNFLYSPFNCDGNNPTKDVNVRKAIAAALDYESINALYFPNGCKEGTEYCTPVTGAYSTPKYSSSDYHMSANVELAKSYLQKAGYNGEEIVFVVFSGVVDASPLVEEMLEAAGMNVKVEYMDSTAASEFVLNPQNNWDFYLATSSVVDVPSTIAPKAISDTWTHTRKDEIMAELGTHPVGSDKSLSLFAELDQILADECPLAIFCRDMGSSFVMDPDLVWDTEEIGIWRFWYNAYWKNPDEHTKN